VQNAWAALGADTTSSEDDDSEEDSAEEQDSGEEEEEKAESKQQDEEEDGGEGAEDQKEEDQDNGEPCDDDGTAMSSIVQLGRSDDPKIQQLMDVGATGEEAKKALEEAGGNVATAAELFFGSFEDRLAALGWSE